MKNKIVNVIVLLMLVLGISYFFYKKSNKHPLDGKEFIGYIPKDALPQLSWGNDNGVLYDIHSIKTIIGKDTFNNTTFPTDGMPGLKLVLYKGLYPPSIDTIVYVRGYYNQNGIPRIAYQASLTPLKE